MTEEDINIVPPDDVTTRQLFMLVRALRIEAKERAVRELEMVEAIERLSLKVEKIRASFDAATTVVKMIKWMAAFGVATIGIVEAVRRLIPQ